MLSDSDFIDIKSRINPAYRDYPGTESHERAMLVGEIERLRGERKVLVTLMDELWEQVNLMLLSSEFEHADEEHAIEQLLARAGAAMLAVREDCVRINTQSTSIKEHQ